ncbi:uncharacterized protein LOC109608324 isoform X2 [Aethina tumida]|uniref:uncharacterized protein LOC109608324 isoform X2 n=1 Tax=Aethina tumida TaxID=116153 RepID=UPI002147A883|nr:uncharacterized protein LOC109608324 isoform X2 [Aethina tumida]
MTHIWAMGLYMLYIFLVPIYAENYPQIEDIPIETYEPLQHGDNDMDLELLPRLSRSLDLEDPKMQFFRYMKALNGEVESDSLVNDRFRNIPKPGGFRRAEESNKGRPRRDVDSSSTTTTTSTSTVSPSVLSEVIQKHLGKPLELGVLEDVPTTEKVESTSAGFKREALSKSEDKRVDMSNTENVMESSRLKREHKSDEPLEKLTLDPKRFDSREARTKESWMKQPYPVRRSDSIHYDDNIPASSESVRAPRVHFVTQRRLESGMPRSYEREARAKNFDRNDYFRDTSREMDYYQPRYSRHYDPMPNHYRYDPYYQMDVPKDRYDSRYDNYYDRERSFNPKRKRIIYYATLPDITRTPPNVDLRDRYNYGDRYDDRYYPYPDRYHPKVLPKSRYDTDRNKDSYPLKVSTDVNVKEIKKNPERRIYSEVDRNRYGYQDRH